MQAAAAVRCGAFGVEFGRVAIGSPQPPVEKVPSSRIGPSGPAAYSPPPRRRAAPFRRRPVRSAAGLPCNRNRPRRDRRAAAAGGEVALEPDRSRSDRQPAAADRTEVACCKLDVGDVGSPQPPLGGGLQFASRRSARTARPLGCGLVSGGNQSRSGWRAAASVRSERLASGSIAQ